MAQACGLHFLTASPYHAPLVDLLAGGLLLADWIQHEEVSRMCLSILAQLGNLLLHLLPVVCTSDPSVIPRRPDAHVDKVLIGAWVEKLLRGGSASLPALLRTLEVSGVSQMSSRIYKDGSQAKNGLRFPCFVFFHALCIPVHQ